jgi:hypothetical protein
MRLRPKQYKDRFVKWEMIKNVKSDQAVWMAQKQRKRKADEGKETIFRLNGRLVKQTKIERHKTRIPQASVAVEGLTFIVDEVAGKLLSCVFPLSIAWLTLSLIATPPGISYGTPRDDTICPDLMGFQTPAPNRLPDTPRSCPQNLVTPIAAHHSQLLPCIPTDAQPQSSHAKNESATGRYMCDNIALFDFNINDLHKTSTNQPRSFSAADLFPKTPYNLSEGGSFNQYEQLLDEVYPVSFPEFPLGWPEVPTPQFDLFPGNPAENDRIFDGNVGSDTGFAPGPNTEGCKIPISRQDALSYISSINFNDANDRRGEPISIEIALRKIAMSLMMMDPMIVGLMSEIEKKWKTKLPAVEVRWLWSEFHTLLASSHEASAASLRQQIANDRYDGKSFCSGLAPIPSVNIEDSQRVEDYSQTQPTNSSVSEYRGRTTSRTVVTYGTPAGKLSSELENWPFGISGSSECLSSSSSVSISFIPNPRLSQTGLSVKFTRLFQENLTPRIYRHINTFNVISFGKLSLFQKALEENNISEVRSLISLRKVSPLDRLRNGTSMLCVSIK